MSTTPNDTQENQSLRGRVMECMSVLALAVGKEKFSPDFVEVCTLINAAQQSVKSADDAQAGFLHQSWSRICRVMGKDFLPYLQHVIPGLIKAAAQDEVADEDDDEEEGVVNVRHSALEEKVTACGMICTYAEILDDGFCPFVEECITAVVLPLMMHYADDIRIAVVQCLPLFMKCGMNAMKASGGDTNSFRAQLISTTLPDFLEAIENEEDPAVLQEQLQALGDYLDNAGRQCLNPDIQKRISEILVTVLQECLAGREAREKNYNDNADDLDEECMDKIEGENETEEDVMMMFMQATGALLKAQGQAVLGDLEPILAKFMELIQPTRKGVDRRLALLVLDDVFEFGGVGMHPIVPQVMPFFAQYLVEDDPSVRQAAAYGIGQLAQNANSLPVVVQAAPQFVAALIQVISGQNSKAKNQVHATDNCISALGKFVEFCGPHIDAQATLQTWLGFLPVTGDLEEGKVIYNTLCKFLEGSMQTVLGANNANLPHVMAVFAEALETEAVDEELTARIKTIVAAMNAQLGAQLQQACQGLNPEQMGKLQRLSA